MKTNLGRRDFLQQTALAGAVLGSGVLNLAGQTKKRKLRKAIMWGTVGVKGTVLEKFKMVKEAGFEGVEPNGGMDQDEVVKAAEETGLKLPSVCCHTHWAKPLSDINPAVRETGLEGLKQSLRDAKRYGSKSVLLVPAVVNRSISYADAYTRSQAEIKKAIPLAEELGVKISIENVWNDFLLSPLEAARYVDEFKSSAVAWHFDIGNVINTGYPEQWISILGPRIQMLHLKEFSRKKGDAEGRGKGFQVDFLQGDNNWPAIMKALDQIGYEGWGIAEQRGGDTPEGLRKLVEAIDKIFES